MRQLLKVTHVGVQQRIVSPPPCHPPTTTTTTTTTTRARALASSRVGSTAGKCFPVALGGGYLMVLKTSSSGNSGTQPPRKKEPPDPRLQGPNIPNQRPAGSIYCNNHFQSKRKPPVLVISKNPQRSVRFRERTGSFLGS